LCVGFIDERRFSFGFERFGERRGVAFAGETRYSTERTQGGAAERGIERAYIYE